MQNIRLTTKFAFLIVAGLLAVGLLVGCTDDVTLQDANADATTVHQIADLLAHPTRFQNNVIATGTTTTFLTQGDLTVIGIVDNEHILMCRNLDCVGERIFGLYTGDQVPPEPGDVITMIGYFEAVGGVWIFMFDEYIVTDNIIDLLQ